MLWECLGALLCMVLDNLLKLYFFCCFLAFSLPFLRAGKQVVMDWPSSKPPPPPNPTSFFFFFFFLPIFSEPFPHPQPLIDPCTLRLSHNAFQMLREDSVVLI